MPTGQEAPRGFNRPNGVATDSSGKVYVGDTDNNTIRIGRAALADVATIDLATGPRGATRLLDTSPQTATSWQWSVIRRPVDAAANLSSATGRNPTFTPDVPGLFTFRVIATGVSTTSITTVNLTVSAGLRGDANNDGAITVGDIFYLINNLFAGGPAPIGPGDANADGGITVGDVFYLINFLFAGGPAPV